MTLFGKPWTSFLRIRAGGSCAPKDAVVENASDKDQEARLGLQQLVTVGALLLVLVNLLTWIAWQYPFTSGLDQSGTPIGGDFPMFYLAAQNVAQGTPERLYNLQDNHADLHQLFPALEEGSVLPYRYPPFVAACLVPLAQLPYSVALTAWIVLLLGLLAMTVYVAAQDLTIFQTEWRSSLLALSLGFPLVWESVLGGQASLIAVAIAVSCELLARRKQFFWAGVILGLAAYKPPVLFFFGLAQVVRFPKLLLGVLTSVVLLLFTGMVICGPQALLDYCSVTLQLTGSSTWSVPTPLHKVHGLLEWSLLVSPVYGKRILVALGCIASMAIAFVMRQKKQQPGATDLGVCLLLLIQSLANPYLPIYDLALLLPALWFGLSAWQSAGGILRASQVIYAQLGLLVLLFGPHLSQSLALQGQGIPKPFALVLLALTLLLAFIIGTKRPARIASV